MNKHVENASPAELKRRGMTAMEAFVARHSRPLSNDIGSRRKRRRLVVATYAGWIAIAVAVKLLSFAFPSSIFLLVLLLVANLSLQAVWLGRGTR